MPSSFTAALNRSLRALALPLFIGWRYTRAKRRRGFLSFISVLSTAGIAIGVMVLIVVMSVMNGFEQELRSRILAMVSHATVQAFDGNIEDWEGVSNQLLERPRVRGAAPFVNGQVMLTRRAEVKGARLRGIIPEREREVSAALSSVISGDAASLEPGAFRIILGSGLARSLGLEVGDKVTVVTPEARMSVAGITPRVRRFTVGGVFDVDMARYDSTLAFIHLADAQALFRTGGGVTGIRLEFDDLFAAPQLAREAAQSLDGLYRFSDWTQQNRQFFRAVQTEKTMMFIILMFIMGIAAFNIISTLVMMVTDKQADIAILRTLGATPRMIMGVFIIQGAIIGVVGMVLGVALGVVIGLNVESIVPAIEGLFGVQFIPKSVYLISDLPSKVETADVVWTALAALILSLLATLYPAWRAARTAPAEALRHD
jgi:lipoprotein-releasing system permease protein